MSKKNWNALDSHSYRSGNTLPVLAAPCYKRQHGATVRNVSPGEVIPAGTPFIFDLTNRTATFIKTAPGAGDPKPNAISIADCIGGTDTTLVDVPYGYVYIYKNTLPAIATDELLDAINEAGDVHLVFEKFGGTNI